jgi:methylenetetrahydrofolate dehydrogenase (NADP+)/methenyltetrahydrofolate cyclohydrolase
VYVRNKEKACAEAGIRVREHRLSATTSQADLLALVRELGLDTDVDGILVQLPLPRGVDSRAVIHAMDPDKDIDGFHPVNIGRLWSSTRGFVPCTPLGVIELLERERIPIEGAEAVVIGRSDIVGRPMAALLLQRHATVTICHSRTRDLPSVARRADILVAAIGAPALVTEKFIKPGATVIDVGINRVDDAGLARALFGGDPARMSAMSKKGYVLVGDVHPVHVREKAGAYTPVPGGVGPLTIAMLLENTLRSALARRA